MLRQNYENLDGLGRSLVAEDHRRGLVKGEKMRSPAKETNTPPWLEYSILVLDPVKALSRKGRCASALFWGSL